MYYKYGKPYNIYMQVDTATNLFDGGNKMLNTSNLSTKLTYNYDDTKDYHFGVRAMDSVGNEEDNTVSIEVLAGNITPRNEVIVSKLNEILVNTNEIPNDVWEHTIVAD